MVKAKDESQYRTGPSYWTADAAQLWQEESDKTDRLDRTASISVPERNDSTNTTIHQERTITEVKEGLQFVTPICHWFLFY